MEPNIDPLPLALDDDHDGIEQLRALQFEKDEAAARARLLLQISIALARTLTLDEVGRAVLETTRAALGTLQTGIALVEDGGREMRFLTLEGLPGPTQQLWSAFPMGTDVPVAEVAREDTQIFLSTAEDIVERYPHLAGDVAQIGLGAWAGVPLSSSGRVLGSLVFHWSHARPFPPEERELLLTVAAQVTQAVERGRLYESQRTIASALQHHLLPRRLPEVDGITTAARYAPAVDEAEVGGDWYDVIVRPDGRIALVLGDVTGHSMRAAAVMGQLRSVVRAYLLEGHSPTGVLERASGFLASAEPDDFATCCLVEVDVTVGMATVVSAGHLPPVLRSGTGSAHMIEVAPGPPLGVDPDATLHEHYVPLRDGDTLVLYSDGLVESSSLPVATGLAALASVASALPAHDLDHFVGEMLRLGEAHKGQDDIAVLACNYHGTPSWSARREATLVLPPDPASAAAARRFTGVLLRQWGFGERLDEARLLVSEVATNAVLHTAAPSRLRVAATDGALRVEVHDRRGEHDAVVREHNNDDATSGRGLLLVRELADRWGISPASDGKVVWFELDRLGPTPTR
jgi:anti-sigma regulatory factor (Ser/Thr protein kinase)